MKQYTRMLLLALLGASPMHAEADTDAEFASASDVNEGALHFLTAPPARPPHHHQNHIRIDADSLDTGWVHLTQCHDHLDAVPRAQITFRAGYIRDLRVETATGIESARAEGASVQLAGIAPGARLCLTARTRALRDRGDGFFMLQNGPYLRRFLDGYYPIRVSLRVDYPATLLGLVDVSPPAQPGLTIDEDPGSVRVEALFEGELTTLIQFRRE
jgi:hypothetical protein